MGKSRRRTHKKKLRRNMICNEWEKILRGKAERRIRKISRKLKENIRKNYVRKK